MSAVRRVNLSSRREGARQPLPGPICHEERIHQLINSCEPDSAGWGKLTCAICFEENVKCAAVTRCRNSGKWCWVCQLKIAKQRRDKDSVIKCALCQDLIQQVYLSRKPLVWEECKRNDILVEEAQAYCCDEEVLEGVTKALKWLCWFPECNFRDLRNEREWRAHIKKDHNRKVCDICFQQKKSEFLPCQHRLYDPADIARHRREGDPIPHVKCPACDIWLFDEEAFFNHWSRADDHVDCQFCRPDGAARAIFRSFDALQEHYQKCHYVCQDCDSISAVFANYQGLLTHQSLEHPRGRRGAVNLEQLAQDSPAPADAGPPPPSAPIPHDQWPDSMIAASPIVLREIQAHLKTALDRQRFYDEAFNTTLTNMCGEQRASTFRQTLHAFLNGKRFSAHDVLGELAHLLWSSYWLVFRAYNKELGQISDMAYISEAKALDTETNIRANIFPTEVAGGAYWINLLEASKQNPARDDRRGGAAMRSILALPCEIMIYFVLHIPRDQHRQKREELLAALGEITKDAAEARARLRDLKVTSGRVEPEADLDADVISEERDQSTGYHTGPILSRLSSLEIGKNLPFVKAAYWALREFLACSGNASMENLNTVPLEVARSMASQRSRSELELCSRIATDLATTLNEQSSDLEMFLSLRPRYANLSRIAVPAIPRPANGKQSVHTRHWQAWQQHTVLSRTWGAYADEVFRKIGKPTLWLIKEYCAVCITLLPQATGVLPQLTGGVPGSKITDRNHYVTVEDLRRQRNGGGAVERSSTPQQIVEDEELPPLPAYVGYNTWRQQAFRPAAQAGSNEQYPPLSASVAAAPPGLVGHSPTPSVRQWARRSTYEPELQECGTCRRRFDPDLNKCPHCGTWMHLTTSQRAQNLIRSEEFPQLATSPSTQAQRSSRPWGATGNNDEFFRTIKRHSGPPKRF